MPSPPPSLSTRLGDVRSSPVRDILELTQRAEVISFAGGLPAPELLPAELIAGAFAQALAPGDAALVENPSSLAALQCFGFAGAKLVPVPCDEDGVDPAALPARTPRRATAP